MSEAENHIITKSYGFVAVILFAIILELMVDQTQNYMKNTG